MIRSRAPNDEDRLFDEDSLDQWTLRSDPYAVFEERPPAELEEAVSRIHATRRSRPLSAEVIDRAEIWEFLSWSDDSGRSLEVEADGRPRDPLPLSSPWEHTEWNPVVEDGGLEIETLNPLTGPVAPWSAVGYPEDLIQESPTDEAETSARVAAQEASDSVSAPVAAEAPVASDSAPVLGAAPAEPDALNAPEVAAAPTEPESAGASLVATPVEPDSAGAALAAAPVEPDSTGTALAAAPAEPDSGGASLGEPDSSSASLVTAPAEPDSAGAPVAEAPAGAPPSADRDDDSPQPDPEPSGADGPMRAPAPGLPEGLEGELETACSANEISAALLQYCAMRFGRAFVLVESGGHASVWKGVGEGTDDPELTDLRVPLDLPSALKSAAGAGAPIHLEAPEGPVDEQLFAQLSPRSPYLVIAAVSCLGAPVAFVYAESALEPLSPEAEQELQTVVELAGRAHARLRNTTA